MFYSRDFFPMNTDADTPPPPPVVLPEEKGEVFRDGDVQAIQYFKEAHALLRHQIDRKSVV